MIMTTSESFNKIEQSFIQDNSVKILSLDCFDTLFWRYVAEPTDIFCQLTIGDEARIKAESKARHRKMAKINGKEVTIYEIYNEVSKKSSPTEIERMVGDEITAEIKNGFVFEPAINILREAKKRNIRTIVVSDIYYSNQQLSKIIEAVSPEAHQLIDKIYCSSDYGVGKYDGLWKKVIQHENVKAGQIFHIGDNIEADYHSPIKLGVNAHHFLQNENVINDILALRGNTANLLLPDYRKEYALPSFYHDWYSVNTREVNVEKIIGCMVLGPILNSFALSIKKQSSYIPDVKIAFLFRDGYMPKKAYDQIFPEEKTFELRISRLTSIKSSFVDKSSIEEHLINTLETYLRIGKTLEGNLHLVDVLCKHLLISDNKKSTLLHKLKNNGYSCQWLIKTLLSDELSKEIIKKSNEFRGNLVKHIQRQTGIKAGETLMLVDLGYEGTTQNKIGHILEQELNIKIIGHYLIVQQTPDWQDNRTGSIAPDRYDYRLISTLTRHIATFELLCSSNDFSATHYDKEGNAKGQNSVDPILLEKVKKMHEYALEFLHSQQEKLTGGRFSDKELSDAIIIDLARYIFFPQKEEIQWLEALQFEVNLGTDAKLRYINREKALDFVKQYGLSRIIDGDANDVRTNNSAELRYLGIENAIWLLASYRYAVNYPLISSIQRKQSIDIVFLKNGKSMTQKIESFYTYDGFYALNIPVIDDAEFVVMIGKSFTALELMKISFVSDENAFSKYETDEKNNLLLNTDYFIDGAIIDEKIIKPSTVDAFIYLKKITHKDKGMIKIIYRPLS